MLCSSIKQACECTAKCIFSAAKGVWKAICWSVCAAEAVWMHHLSLCQLFFSLLMGYDHSRLLGLGKKSNYISSTFLKGPNILLIWNKDQVFTQDWWRWGDALEWALIHYSGPVPFLNCVLKSPIWKKSVHCAPPIAQSKCAKGGCSCTLGRWEGHQGQVGSHIPVNVRDIWMPAWHFIWDNSPSRFENQDGACSFSQCIFSLCRVIYFHNSVVSKIPWVGIVWVVLGWVPHVLCSAIINILQSDFYWSADSSSSVLGGTGIKWALFSFEIRLSLWHFSVFAVLHPLCLPEGRSCCMLDHFEIAYLEKSMPDTLASPQPDVPLYFHVSYKGIVEMPAVFSESTMVCQGYPSLSWAVTPL